MELTLEAASFVRDVVGGTRSAHKASVEKHTNGQLEGFSEYGIIVEEPPLEWTSGFGTNCFCGKYWVRKTVAEGQFCCPCCHCNKHYKLKDLNLACHWYWIPLCKEKIGQYVKCPSCGMHYLPMVLEKCPAVASNPGKVSRPNEGCNSSKEKKQMHESTSNKEEVPDATETTAVADTIKPCGTEANDKIYDKISREHGDDDEVSADDFDSVSV